MEENDHRLDSNEMKKYKKTLNRKGSFIFHSVFGAIFILLFFIIDYLGKASDYYPLFIFFVVIIALLKKYLIISNSYTDTFSEILEKNESGEDIFSKENNNLKIEDDVQQFGISPNYLASLVIAEHKKATSSGYIFYEFENQSLPQIDNITTFSDFNNNPLVDVKVKSVDIIKISEVSNEQALLEGEGDYEFWKKSHYKFFNDELNRIYSFLEGGLAATNLWGNGNINVSHSNELNYRYFPETSEEFGILDKKITEDFKIVFEQFEIVSIYPKTYEQWLDFAAQTLLEKADQDPFLNAKFDANLLLQAVTKRSKSAIFAFSETLLNEQELKQLAELLVRRANGEPMAYILGEKEFWSLPLAVSTATLIPRPDTERLVEVALEKMAQIGINNGSKFSEKLQILDLGTGTGAIALALGSELGERAEILGVDKLPEAVALAEQNRQKLGLTNVQFCQSDWFSAIGSRQFDLIVSNPPYIDENDENLAIGDVRFEPLSALVADHNGTSDLRQIIENSPRCLRYNGVLILEHGWQQASWVQQQFKQNQWDNIETFQDYGGNDRVTAAVWKGDENNNGREHL